MEHLKKEGAESKKIEYLLSAALSCADMTMKLITDIECRVKKQRERTKDKRDRNLLKRDLNMCEQMEDAYEKIGEKIHEIEQQFNWYVQPHFDSAFRKDGKYDSENGDKFNSDTGEFIVCLLKYIRGCFRNENNTQIVSDCLDSLVNNQYCPLEEKDINHYNVTI